MKPVKKRWLTWLALGLAIVFVVSGCQGKPQQQPQGEGKGSGEVVEGGEVVIAVPVDPDYLDPHKATAAATREMMFNVFEGLYKPAPNGDLVPAIADSYEVSQDGTVYTFHLRAGVQFHNGNPVTVEDVLYSFQRIQDPVTNNPSGKTFANVLVEKVDDQHVRFTLPAANPAFLANLSNMNAAIIPAGSEDINQNPVGTGPFQFVEYIPEQYIQLKKNEHYWQAGIPYLDQVEFRFQPDVDAALIAFQAGEYQIYPRVNNDSVDMLKQQAAFKVIAEPQRLVQLLALNNERTPFQDIRVRQALNYAVDRDALIEAVAYGYGSKIASSMSPAMENWYIDANVLYPHDLEKARQLLEEAGYGNGFSATISVPSNYDFHVKTAEVIAQQLKPLKINLKIEKVEWGVWLDRIYTNRDYEMTIIGFEGKLDPSMTLDRYTSDYARNFMNYKSVRYDEAFQKAASALNMEERHKLYQDVQMILAEDAASVFLMDPDFLVAMTADLDGFQTYTTYVLDMSTVHYIR